MNIVKIFLQKTHVMSMCFLLIMITACKPEKEYKSVSNLELLEERYVTGLDSTIENLNSILLAKNVNDQLKFYLVSRDYFKKTEPLLAFVDKHNFKSLNQPNILKVEEEDATDIKESSPFGFQVLEEQLHDDEVTKDEINRNVNRTISRLKLIRANTKLKLKEYHVLWLLRDEIARVALTGITGFDSPVLERSLKEARIVYKELKVLVSIYKSNFKSEDLYNNWLVELDKAISDLNHDFASFDRYKFIKNHTHKQLELLVNTKEDWKIEFPLELALNNNATSLFSNSTFNIIYFSDHIDKTSYNEEKIALGKALFNDKNLSVNTDMSCATCHHKDKAFTDGLKAFPKQLRNTPTLTYSSLQKSFFHDGRAGSLEGQVAAVVKNANEFHSDLETMKKAVESDSNYVLKFQNIYKANINQNNIRNAIATYVRSLNQFNSKFDKNINNLENTLSESEINGFNLFMGTAKCATCHFAPVFNGTVPPNFSESELEAIGVPLNLSKDSPIDTDLGRFNLFKTESRKHFFKTPTVRNIALTAPYMHNGVYNTLEEVMEFYNNGGGSGLDIVIEHQTLPTDSLNLTENQVKDIIDFMNSLSDDTKS